MNGWRRKLVLSLILVVMPLQGVAATLSVLLCHNDAQVHEVHAGAGHDHADSDSSHDHGVPSNDGSEGALASFHLCCNVTAFVPSQTGIGAQLSDFPVRAFAPDTLHDLFIPDRPQRPPLA